MERPDARCARAGGRAALAVRLGDFLLGPLSDGDGRLHRTWRDGVAKGTGYLSDYADTAYGFLELHVATGDLRWLREAHRLALTAVRLFGAADGAGFVQVPVDGEQLIAPKIELDDHPTPSGNAMLAYVLLRLGRIWGDDELEQLGVGVLRLVRDVLTRAPSGFGWGSSRSTSTWRPTARSRSPGLLRRPSPSPRSSERRRPT